MQQIFQKKENLEADLKEKLILGSQVIVKQEQLLDYFIHILKNDILERKIDKSDLEYFLSSFRYNIHAYTDINKVTEQIFLDEKEISSKLTLNQRPIPPVKSISSDNSKTNQELSSNNEKLQRLVKDLEFAIFDTNYKIFDIYRKFDIDGYGYVSEIDIKNYFNKINLKFEEPEFNAFINNLNMKPNGYIDFDSFRKIFGQNMYYKFGKD